MRPNRGFVPLFFWIFVGLSIPIAVCLLIPPIPLVEAIAHRALGPDAEWRGVSRLGPGFEIKNVEFRFRSGVFRAARVQLLCSPLRGLLTRTWPLEFKEVRIQSMRPRLPAVYFEAGRARWLQGERRLVLEDWVSPAAQIGAELRWESRKLQSVHVTGRADSVDLGEILKIWKPLGPGSSAAGAEGFVSKRPETEENWRTFDLKYEKGRLEIQVDSRPFFRASWKTSNGAF